MSLSRLHQVWLSLPRSVRYLLVGFTNTAVGYCLFALCFLELRDHLPYWGVLATTHLLAVTYSFFTQRFLVFVESSGNLLRKFILFQFSYLWLAPQGIAINWGLVHFWSWSPWTAQGAAMAIGILTAFALHKRLVFRTSA